MKKPNGRGHGPVSLYATDGYNTIGTDQYLLSKSWLYPAEIKGTSAGLSFDRYDPIRRAYLFTLEKAGKGIELKMMAKSPILNPISLLGKK